MKCFIVLSVCMFAVVTFLINREKLASKYNVVLVSKHDLNQYVNVTLRGVKSLCHKYRPDWCREKKKAPEKALEKALTKVTEKAPANVCIVTAFKKPHTKEFFDYNEYEQIIPYTISNMWNYARINGYRIFLFNEDMFDTTRKSSWVKIPLITKYFDRCDWVMYTDVDWLFLSKDPLPIDPKYDIIVSNECIKGNAWKKMSGTIIIKNSPWSKQFLKRWNSTYEQYRNVINHDQVAFQNMVRDTPKEMKVLSPQNFMSYDTHNCVQPKFGVHLPAGGKPKRLNAVMDKYKIPKLEYASVKISNEWVNYQVPFQMHGLKADIVVGILSHGKKKRMAIRKLGHKVFFLVGKGIDYDEFYEYNDMIYINRDEEYKTQVFLHAVETHLSDYNYILKIDDDNLVNFDALKKELDDVKPDYWVSGAGDVLSRKANECIVEKLATMKFMPQEDAATGILAKKCGIEPVNSNKVQHLKPEGDDYIIRHFKKPAWCTKFPNRWNGDDIDVVSFVDILRYFNTTMLTNGIDYSLGFGTALGYRRHNDFIPWDDDVDLIIKKKDSSSARALVQKPFCTANFWGGWKIFKCDSPRTSKYEWNYPFVDVFDNGNTNHHHKSAYDDIIFPSVGVFMHGMALRGPKRLTKHLDTRYGGNYMETCESPFWNHKTETGIANHKRFPCKNVLACFTE